MANDIVSRKVAEPVGGYQRTEEELREWCWEKNQQCREAKYAHWLYVNRDKDSGALICRAKSGADALDVIQVLNGWYPDYQGWDAERLESEFRILRHCARMGIPEHEWEARFARKLIGAV